MNENLIKLLYLAKEYFRSENIKNFNCKSCENLEIGIEGFTYSFAFMSTEKSILCVRDGSNHSKVFFRSFDELNEFIKKVQANNSRL